MSIVLLRVFTLTELACGLSLVISVNGITIACDLRSG